MKPDVKMNLRGMRARVGMTQTEVAEKLGTTKQAYSRHEGNPDSMKIGMAYKLSKIFNCELYHIFLPSDVPLRNNKEKENDE